MSTILIADDERDIRTLLECILADAGHDVATAVDGAQALELMSVSPPDLLVLDSMMPKVDGYKVLEEMRDRGYSGRIKVLMVTAKTSETDWDRGLEAGADAYMTKPFDPDELLAQIDEMLDCSPEQLEARRESEQQRARLLSQLENLLEIN